MMKPLTMLSFLVCLLMPTGLYAEIYSYTDEKGRKVFVNHPAKIPAKFREQNAVPVIRSESITPEQKQAREFQRDLQTAQLRLKRQLRKLEDTLARMETPVTLRGNQVLVPVRVNWRGRKKDLNLLLDTGASVTVIHQQAVAALNPVSRSDSYAQVAGGGLIKTQRVIFDSLSVGPYDLNNKTTAVIEDTGTSGFDGLLGMDILGSFRYQIDFAGSRIIWSPSEYEQIILAMDKLKALQDEAAAQMK